MSDDNWRECYEDTGNPVYVWHAIASVLLRGEPLPDWIAGYLLRASLGIIRAKGTTQERTAAALDALQIVIGNRNAFAEEAKENDALWVNLSYEALGGGDRAAEIMATEQGASSVQDVDKIMQRVRRRVAKAKKSPRYTE